MPSPCKKSRRVCAMPVNSGLAPVRASRKILPAVTMTVDGFEAIRLVDLMGLTQEKCAKSMDIARTTVQSIYSSARLKLAECLVYGKALQIEGGDYFLCNGDGCGCTHCQKKKYPQQIKNGDGNQ